MKDLEREMIVNVIVTIGKERECIDLTIL